MPESAGLRIEQEGEVAGDQAAVTRRDQHGEALPAHECMKLGDIGLGERAGVVHGPVRVAAAATRDWTNERPLAGPGLGHVPGHPGSRRGPVALRLLGEELLPHVNLFCYGQVESPYGSGEYIRALRNKFGEKNDKLVLSEIEDKEGIYNSIKAFLGKGK